MIDMVGMIGRVGKAGKRDLIKAIGAATAGMLLAFCLAQSAVAVPGNVAATPHNLSKSGPGPVKSSSEDQICAFCHTPHGANTSVTGPLWNRNVDTAKTYTRYTSSSLDANTITDGFNAQPGGSSVLCLSCHDGLLALGNVNVLRGQPANITLSGTTSENKMNPGASTNTAAGSSRGALTGFTRVLGDDLSNDHPISITYNDDLATQDGEFEHMNADQGDLTTGGKLIAVRGTGMKPVLPLEPTGKGKLGQVQCASCHDPHLNKSKFLRLNRFQVNEPSNSAFSESGDQICLACHRKLMGTWAESVHAKKLVADEPYQDAAADLRGFPRGTQVWQAACLNCHDTHTVQGSRRLLREGVGGSGAGTAPGNFQLGSSAKPLDTVSALENTCYQCHNSTKILNTATSAGTVPDIKSEFDRTYHMPIATADQAGTSKREVHDITNADFIETPENLGFGKTENRHVECTDCHNPHRARRSSVFYGTSDSTGEGAKRTHNAGGAAADGSDGNVASGALRGAWGVEPVYDTRENDWPQPPSRYEIKKGDPGTNTSTARTQGYLTREYQLCMKCHSDYANSTTATSFPSLGNTGGSTSNPTNGMTRYTNVAAEFGSGVATETPSSSTDQGEYGESTYTGTPANEDNTAVEPTGSYPADAGSCTTSGQAPCVTDVAGTQNHRSWHPVMYPTGRTRDERRMASSGGNFRPPFAAKVGTQTMHCSDCHGHSASWTAGTGPNSSTQGPHGSDKPFILKGDWSTSVTIGTNGLCGNCHSPAASSGTGDNAARVSGFNNSGEDGGGGHANEHDGRVCMRCHIALPHGWKNKAFLVNLNCVGKEAGRTSCDPANGYGGYGGSAKFTVEPYYNSASLRIRTWRASGNWTAASCGTNGYYARDWMRDGASC